MKQHLNNKGVTLVELIVSFALVATAIIYFYQTLYTVKKLYSQSQKETNEFVDVNYVYRLTDEIIKEQKYFFLNVESYQPENNNNVDISSDEISKLTLKAESGEKIIFSTCFNGWNDEYKKFVDGKNIDSRYRERTIYPRSINTKNSTFFEVENDILPGINDFDKKNNNNGEIIQMLTYYLNVHYDESSGKTFPVYRLNCSNSEDYFSCGINDIPTVSDANKYNYNFKINSSDVVNNIYDYGNNCFNNEKVEVIKENSIISSDNTIDQIDLWLSADINSNYYDIMEKNNIKISDGKFYYNPYKKILKFNFKYKEKQHSYYTFYDYKGDVYYSSYWLIRESDPGSHEYTILALYLE